MMYQVIEGQKLYSVGAMWFKVSEKTRNFQELIKLRHKQISHYSGGNIFVGEALCTLANDGRIKSYDQVFLQQIEAVVKRMLEDGVHKQKP